MLLGGSQSEEKKKYIHGFFYESSDVESFTVSKNKNVKLRILPAFDETKRGTDAFKTSYAPYRAADPDATNKEPQFTGWYIPVTGYTFYGNNKLSFLSNLTRPGMSRYRGGICPVNDIFAYCYNSKDADIKKLTVRPADSNKPTVAPRPRKWALMNCYMEDINTQEMSNKVVIVTDMAKERFLEDLNCRAGRDDEIITPEWKTYLYGDITDPDTGSTIFTRAYSDSTNPMLSFGRLYVASKPNYLDGRQPWPLGDEKDKILAGRYDICDDSNITRIRTYDEVLELVVNDGAVPYQIIERACKPHGDIPAPPKGIVTSTPEPTVQPNIDAVVTTSESTAQVAVATPTVEAAPNAVEPVKEEPVAEPTKVIEQPEAAVSNAAESKLSSEEAAEYAELTKRMDEGDILDGDELSKLFRYRQQAEG